jgi:pimeloyl-ACP methyl ester carboxylesterase
VYLHKADTSHTPLPKHVIQNKSLICYFSRPGIDDRSVADICADPSSLKAVTIADVVNRYEEVIKRLPTPPIIIGHSFGGLMVQILLSRGYGCAGVAISAAGPAGVNVLTLSTIKSTLPILSNPFNQNGLLPLSLQQFNYIFTNELDEKDSETVYKEFCVPGSAHVLWQGALSGFHSSGDGKVIWDKADRAPLLLIGGSKDHIVPESVPQTVVKTYTGPAIVEYKGFAGRTHHIVGQTGWEEVADYSLAWVEKHLK